MDFKTNIQDLIKQGKSFDEISKMFENEFNAAKVAISENELDAIYEKALDAIDKTLEEENMFTKEDVINAAVCWAIDQHGDWVKDDIDVVKDTIDATLDIIESGINVLKPMLAKEKKKNFGGEFEFECTDKDAIRKFLATL